MNDKEKEWLNKFNKESINASFDSENPKKNIHRSKKLRKECYDRNNARNRDILTRTKASNQLDELYSDPTLAELSTGGEDWLIDMLDKQEIFDAISWLAEGLDKDEKKLEEFILENVKDRDKS